MGIKLDELSVELRIGVLWKGMICSPDPRPIVPAVGGRVAVSVGRRRRAGAGGGRGAGGGGGGGGGRGAAGERAREAPAARCKLQASQVSGYCCESMFGTGSRLQVSSGLGVS